MKGLSEMARRTLDRPMKPLQTSRVAAGKDVVGGIDGLKENGNVGQLTVLTGGVIKWQGTTEVKSDRCENS